MCRFWRGFQAIPPVAIGHKVVGNTFQNPEGYTYAFQTVDDDFIAVVIPDGASSNDQGPAFTFQNNLVTGFTIGVVFTAESSTTTTMAAFAMTNNHISGPFQNRVGPVAGFYMLLYNTPLSLAVPQNW
jgi:hypothetical protein